MQNGNQTPIDSHQPGSVSLSMPVQFLAGVGPRRAEKLAHLGIDTVADLLEYYPRDHEFIPPLALMSEINVGREVTITGQIEQMRYNSRSRPPRFELVLSDDTGPCRVVWFRGGYLRDQLLPGDIIAVWGKVSRYRETIQLVNPRWMKIIDPEDLLERSKTGTGVYPAGGEISSPEISRLIRRSLDTILPLEKERYLDKFRAQRKLPTRSEALEWIHRPPTPEHIGQARRRLAYDELFLMELAIALRREKLLRLQPAYPLPVHDKLDQRIRRLFPFTLTDDQNKVIAEIVHDLARSEPMNRLLQGDVGSGKTIVALYAALLAVGHHRQVAIMAPTEILAEQHFASIEKYLQHSRVRRTCLTGGLASSERKQKLRQIQQGQMDIIVGTQALLQKDVTFQNLALVVIDEQHKFGVRQREVIRGKDIAPHYLVMTATPIPRTLAMTVFGDLDVSTINHLPPGRSPVVTSWIRPEMLGQAYESIRRKITQGQQAYFVYPRVEDNIDPDDQDNLTPPLKAATAQHEHLQKKIFPEFNVGLLHGQMDRDRKQIVMDDFRSGKIQILVTTVVIEVGVDVPNATIMVIEHADRFGLAQLHQLRGRIGRGTRQSYCLLFGRARTESARQRLEIMTQSGDGFRISEEDLRIRGPGEFFGTAQHGLPELKIANLLEDFDLLGMARRDAFELAQEDFQLQLPQNQILRQALHHTFGNDLGLVNVG